jgi:hypothetical protein
MRTWLRCFLLTLLGKYEHSFWKSSEIFSSMRLSMRTSFSSFITSLQMVHLKLPFNFCCFSSVGHSTEEQIRARPKVSLVLIKELTGTGTRAESDRAANFAGRKVVKSVHDSFEVLVDEVVAVRANRLGHHLANSAQGVLNVFL